MENTREFQAIYHHSEHGQREIRLEHFRRGWRVQINDNGIAQQEVRKLTLATAERTVEELTEETLNEGYRLVQVRLLS